MARDRFDEIMRDWLDDELQEAPPLQPTETMRRRVLAKSDAAAGGGPRRWVVAAVAAAVLLALLIPWLLEGDTTAESEMYVASRTWRVAVEAMELEGAVPGRGPGRGGRGPRPAFEVAIFQRHLEGTRTVRGIDLRSAPAETVRLAAGDAYRLAIRPGKAVHVRIFQTDGNDRLQRLYPQEEHAEDGRLQAGVLAYAPPGPRWFHLTRPSPGELLILVAADEPLGHLDAMLRRYQSAVDPDGRRTTRDHLLDAIEALKGDAAGGVGVLELRFVQD